MATRENQGLQIALIIFLMLTVGLAISTYVYFRSSEEQTKVAEAAEAKAKASDAKYRAAYYQVQSLKYMVGVPNITPEGLKVLATGLPAGDEGIRELDAIKRDYDSDMAMFNDSVPPQSRNWRTLPRFLLSSLNKRSTELESAVADRIKMSDEKDAVVLAEGKKVTTAEDGLKKATEDVVQATHTFTATVQDGDKLKTDLEAQLEKVRKDSGDQIARLQKELKDEQDKGKKLLAELRGHATRIKDLTNETFERPHGQVTWVNLRDNTCYINLGRADGLQRQITFAVYDPGVTTLEVPTAGDERKSASQNKTKRKASIEVLELLDDHLALCRILEDDVKNPILPGDQIFTPAWRPGERLQFALVGRMNIDGDKDDDRQKIKNLIEANGGQIVAEVMENGNRTGNITPSTRFLVKGDPPGEAASEEYRNQYNNILGAADRNGVQQISARDLALMMGYKGTDRTVTLGTPSTSDELKRNDTKGGFRARPKPGGAPAAAPADAGAF